MNRKGDYINKKLKAHVPQQIGNTVSINSLWSSGLTILKIMPRLGCPLTRYEAQILSQHFETFDEFGIRLVAIGLDFCNAKDFIVGGYWKGELYIDISHEIYDYFELSQISKLQAMRNLFNPSTRKQINKVKKETHGSIWKDDLQLGGTFVINRRGKIIFSFIQESFTDSPSVNEIVDFCCKYSKAETKLRKSKLKEKSKSKPKKRRHKKRISRILNNGKLDSIQITSFNVV